MKRPHLWIVMTNERLVKTARLLGPLAEGWGGEVRFTTSPPPDDGAPFVVWGQQWITCEVIPRALASGRPFWHVDNGFHRPGGGHFSGYYRATYRAMWPHLWENAPPVRGELANTTMRPWRTDGRHIVLALPGETFGRAAGLDVAGWVRTAEERLRAATKRPIVVRRKPPWQMRHTTGHTLAHDLLGAWALVTHSSNVAVDAVIAGVPVFVEPTSPAAPVGRTVWDLENPATPDRTVWWRSLMAQQFTLTEFKTGFAVDLMTKLAREYDDVHVQFREHHDRPRKDAPLPGGHELVLAGIHG